MAKREIALCSKRNHAIKSVMIKRFKSENIPLPDANFDQTCEMVSHIDINHK